MYLSKLEILGFKSFQQRTVVNLNPGITAIVGPNGCGKTNIVDAIRWSLGEQKSSILRSDKMENVIFNGTSAKKPMGMAEVSLTIQNDKGVLPTEYSEVIITRRIFRSGESEYLLNKNVCRLKDITNLFMDTGMGANAYSVIELKMVEAILSNRTDERRVMFEEAAGVNKYKLRRRLTLRKLDDVKADLTRVNDIISEVQKTVNSLSRQAKKADRANALKKELEEVELEWADKQFAAYTIDINDITAQKENYKEEKSKIESELTEINEQLAAKKNEQLQVETQLKSKRSEISDNVDKIHQTQQTISVSEESRKSLIRNIERFRQDIDEFKYQIEITEEEIEDSIARIQDIEIEIEDKQRAKSGLSGEVKEKNEVLEAKKDELRSVSERVLEKFQDITNRNSDLTRIENSIEDVKESIAKLETEIEDLTGNIAKTVGYIEELGEDKEDVQKRLKEAEDLYNAKQTEKEKLESELSNLRARELETRGIINDLKGKISFLQNLINNLEGFSRGTKSLLENGEWTSKDVSLLANIGNSDEKYRFAIEASLKKNLNNILVESLEEIKSAIEYLRDKDSGKASFYLYRKSSESKSLLSRIEKFVTKGKMRKLENEEGFLGWAHTFVKTEKKWKPFFKALLYNTAVIETLDKALALSRKYPNFNFTTLEGDMIDQNGVIEAGAAPAPDDTLFGRKQMLENLSAKLPGHEEQLQKLTDKIADIEAELSNIDLKSLSEKTRILYNDLSNVERQIGQFEFEKKKASDEIDKNRDEINDLVSRSNRLEIEKDEITKLIEQLQEKKSSAEAERSRLEEEFNRYESEYDEIIEKQNELNLVLERLSGEKNNSQNAVKRGYETIENLNKTIVKREEDIKTAGEESESLDMIIGEKQEELQEFYEIRDRLYKEQEEIDEKYQELRNYITGYEEQQSELRNKRDGINEEMHQFDIKLKELGLNLDNLKKNIRHKYEKELEFKEFDDLDEFDFRERESHIGELERKLSNMGPVNLLAYEEFEEEQERLNFLEQQREDLIESEKDLVKTINEINDTAKTLFLKTFQDIRENFIKIFRTLFNAGDEADLKLDEEADPLEAKIEIMAKPKGKRPTSIELLSGGEKTLTAIALLFAIYLVKPSPFCILDEIDAPLDDANIDRFSKILHEFAKNTQFIVVTHNKRTMEQADTMYGVTMQDEGISKLVSVKFNEDFNVVA